MDPVREVGEILVGRDCEGGQCHIDSECWFGNQLSSSVSEYRWGRKGGRGREG